MDDYVKLPELARRLDISERTARRYVKAGVLPSVFVGGAYRVREVDLAEYLDRARVEPGKAPAPPSDQPPLFSGSETAEERREATIENAARGLLAIVEPAEAKISAGTFTDEDRRNLNRAAALVTPLLQVALEAEAGHLRERYPGVYDVGPYAVLGPVIARFVAVVFDAGGVEPEAEQTVRDLEEHRRTAYLAAA